MAGNKVELKPERPFADEIDPYTSEAFERRTSRTTTKTSSHPSAATEKPRASIDLACGCRRHLPG